MEVQELIKLLRKEDKEYLITIENDPLNGKPCLVITNEWQMPINFIHITEI